jgi:DNA polymerase-4
MSACWQDEARLRWLFLDLNSYFASVEQQEDPRLRGKPVIVVPVLADSTCAIAASYEAKAYGIRTGTRVGDAKRMCPGLICVEARHEVYVDYHHRIIDEVDRHVHVTKVCSVDEVACELVGPDRLTANALALASRIKHGIAARIGTCLRSSIGLAPSQLLAKIASDLEKPDGLTLIGADCLPGPLFGLALTDLPGIGRKMERRLAAGSVRSIADFWHLSPRRARSIWGGIGGEHFWYGLHGVDPPERATQRHSISHSQVLAPDLRSGASAFAVARRLLAKAASRLRRMDYRAGVIGLDIRLERGGSIDMHRRVPLTQDSFALLAAFNRLQTQAARALQGARVRKIGVALAELGPCASDQPDLFGWTPASGENPRAAPLPRARPAQRPLWARYRAVRHRSAPAAPWRGQDRLQPHSRPGRVPGMNHRAAIRTRIAKDTILP